MTRTQPPVLARDYAAEYTAARVANRSTEDLTERAAHAATARRVLAAARRAGVALDEIALDEAARVAVHGATRPAPAPVQYHPITGAPIL